MVKINDMSSRETLAIQQFAKLSIIVIS